MKPAEDLVLWGGSAVDLDAWSANAAHGSRTSLSVESGRDGAALRFDFTLVGHGSWAIARYDGAFELPAHYVVALRLRGEAPPNELQLKLIDPSGTNVWWWRRRDFAWPRAAERFVFRRASLEFAWGPASGGEPEHVRAVELAVAAGQGGSGTLWIDDLRIEARPPATAPPRIRGVRASSSLTGHGAEQVLAGAEDTGWRPDPGDPSPWIEVDLGETLEWGGLVVDFGGAAGAPRGVVLTSDDAERWTWLADVGGASGRRWLRTGEVESRFARMEFPGGTAGADVADVADIAIVRVAVVPIELAVSPARWAAAVARAAPRGRFPRHLLGEQAYWALVGGDGDERKGLLSEDGALEIDAEAFTVEPFLWTEGRTFTWADVEGRVALHDGCLPIPSVEWTAGALRLTTTAFAAGEPQRSALVARYVVENSGGAPREARLILAIRPFQVTPAWQSLNLTKSGVTPIVHLARAGARIRVNGERDVIAVTRPDGFGAARVEEGEGGEQGKQGSQRREGAQGEEGLNAFFEERIPERVRIDDPLGFAEGALVFDLHLRPGESETIVIAVPLFDATPALPSGLARVEAAAWSAARLAEVAAHWHRRLERVPIVLPPSAAPLAATLRASIAWILVNREGPRIQPGPRCYRRSWIRDGTLTGTALTEMGFAEEARAFLRWYAPYQGEDGRVPCAVDRRGIDRAVEHDSHGQLAWGVVEVFRLTGDRTFLRELWPHVLRAVDAIAALRAERTGDALRGEACFGLLPESISHEGYASRPVHAYWDDFFAVRGLADAAEAAAVLGDTETAARIGALRDAMRHDLHASIARTMARHGIDFLPGSVELGDFDPTSSAIAFDPCGEGARLPRAALERTFERYWAEFDARRRGEKPADAYTPYEIRNVTALLRIGWRDRALALLEWLVADQRPRAWCQWPEVAWRDTRAPRFLGDLPHGWVASSFLRTLRRMLAYEREEDGALVIAAGVPEAWVREAPGVAVRGLATYFGSLTYTMAGADAGRVRVTIAPGLGRPPGGIVITSPGPRPLREVVADGRARPAEDPARVHLRDVPAEVLLDY